MKSLLFSHPLCMSRRRFLRQSVFASLSCVLLGTPWICSVAGESASVANNIMNVKDKGAVGDGHHDDTASIQAAIDALSASGGTVHIPSGRYLIDTNFPLRLHNNMHLDMAVDAVLVAKPSTNKRFYVMLIDRVSDIEVSGGSILGEREQHLGSGGEWGYGIFVRGSDRVKIHDIRVSDCWGDGICVGAAVGKGITAKYSTDITLTRVVCVNNRRQGLTIGPARHVRVLDSEFNGTGGTAPAAGIDIEPDNPETAEDIVIENCVIRGNKGCGIQVYRNVSSVSIKNCKIENNGNYGVLMYGARQSSLMKSTVSESGLTGVMIRGGSSNCQLSGNIFKQNSKKTASRLINNIKNASLKSVSVSGLRDVQVMDDSHSITVTGNTFSN